MRLVTLTPPVAPHWWFLFLFLEVTAPRAGLRKSLSSVFQMFACVPSLLHLSSVSTPVWFYLEFVFERGIRICFTFSPRGCGWLRGSWRTHRPVRRLHPARGPLSPRVLFSGRSSALRIHLPYWHQHSKCLCLESWWLVELIPQQVFPQAQLNSFCPFALSYTFLNHLVKFTFVLECGSFCSPWRRGEGRKSDSLGTFWREGSTDLGKLHFSLDALPHVTLKSSLLTYWS